MAKITRSKEAPLPMSPNEELGNLDVQVDLGVVPTVTKSAADKIKEVIASLPVEQLGDGVDLTQGGQVRNTTVVVNQPTMPTQEALGMQMTQATAAGAMNALSKTSDPNMASILTALADAPKYKEKAKTSSTQAVINNQLVQIPSAVRDLPANLYIDSNNQYVRGEADQILLGLFGDVASLVNMWAHRRGFAHKPLVWASNTIFHYVELDKPVDYTAPIVYDRPVYQGKDSNTIERISYVPSLPYDPAIDEDNHGLVIMTLNRFIYHLTVRNLVRIAKEQNLSLVEVVRCIIGQYNRDNSPKVAPRI